MIEKVDHHNFEDVLPLIRAYQEFYNMAEIDDEKNRSHFGRFLDDNSRGVLHIIISEGQVAGFSTIYFNFSSTKAEEVAVLNDLFIKPEFRGKGMGRLLVEHAIETVTSRGIRRIQWLTTLDNTAAHKLYDSLGARKSEWYLYAKETYR